MKQKINVRLIGIAILAVFATLISITLIFYSLFEKQVRKDLRIHAKILKEAKIFTKEENSLQDLRMDTEELRITWIDEDGTVLYDNDTDAKDMENHSDRPEIAAAYRTGSGESVRRSDTMNRNTFYCALRLEDGTVLRVSTETRSLFNVFFTVVPMIALILTVIILLCILCAHFLTRQLLQPIEDMVENMEDMETLPVYKELVPFVNRIRMQHENILMAAKVRQDFTANVSHELKTPLTAISGYAELIENHMIDEGEETRIAQGIRRNADRLVRLINDIIRLSELDNSEDEIRYESLDLCELAENAIEFLKVFANRRGVSLLFEGERCLIRANREMMGELIDNLCQNAIRYNNEGGKVTVKVTHEKKAPVLIVSDNGIGIPKEQQERVFERFYRVDKSRSKETGGTGLGLAIVKHIVELHGASITLNSEIGKGTTIRVEF